MALQLKTPRRIGGEKPAVAGVKEKGPALITITYQVGSGGVEIGQAVARELGLDYVDRQIVQQAAQKIGIRVAQAGNEPVEEKALGIRPGFISMLSQANPTALQALA